MCVAKKFQVIYLGGASWKKKKNFLEHFFLKCFPKEEKKNKNLKKFSFVSFFLNIYNRKFFFKKRIFVCK